MLSILEALLNGLGERWPLLALAMLPAVLRLGVSTVFYAVQRVVSGDHGDELPQPAGTWVRDQADRLGLEGLRVEPTPAFSAAMDAMIPSAQVIVLRTSTWTRADPVSWAIGAHELGHAIHARQAPWGSIFTIGRGLAHGLDQLLVAALLVMVLVGGPLAPPLALGLLVATLASHVVFLADEAWASISARAMLVEDGRLDPGQLRRATVSLFASFGAHMAAFVGLVATLVAWPWIQPGPAPLLPGLPALGLPALLVLAALSLPLLKRGLRVGLQALVYRPPETLSDLGRKLLREAFGDQAGGLGALVLVAMALTLPSSPWRDVALVLAVVPALVPLRGLLAGFAELPLRMALGEVDKLTAPPDPRTAPAAPESAPRVVGSPLVTLELFRDDGWLPRMLQVLRIAYLPLLVVFWTLQSARLPGLWAALPMP